MKLYGIAFLKNGVKFDYPFKESLYSLLPLVEKVYINVGKSDDGTLEEVRKIPKVEIIEVEWPDHRNDNGYIFSDMTNIAIDKMRSEVQDSDAWAIYLQSDEVIHEDDYDLIRSDLAQAEKEQADALSFRYIHFWGTHNQIAINPNWYPHEIRAFKVMSKVRNHADAQTFSGQTKVFHTDAHIWHYGHVREKTAYKNKVDRQDRYHNKGLKFYRKKLKRYIKSFFHKETLIPFFGSHPKVMASRIERFQGRRSWQIPQKLFIKADKNLFSSSLINNIVAKEVIFTDQTIKKTNSNELFIDFSASKWKKSLSPNCKTWTNDFTLSIELSRHDVFIDKNFK